MGDTPFRWLNLEKLSRFLVPELQLERIRYFTAIIPRRGDPQQQQQQRQQAYLRALRTIPSLSIHLGRFVTLPTRLPLAHPLPGGPKTVEVLRTEEKGSDVNLATWLLTDGCRGDADVAVVVSNDSDLIAPIEMARAELGLQVGVVITDPRTRRSVLPADFHRRIRARQLAACQFPENMTDARDTMQRPLGW